MDTPCIQSGYVGKDRIGKDRIGKGSSSSDENDDDEHRAARRRVGRSLRLENIELQISCRP